MLSSCILYAIISGHTIISLFPHSVQNWMQLYMVDRNRIPWYLSVFKAIDTNQDTNYSSSIMFV